MSADQFDTGEIIAYLHGEPNATLDAQLADSPQLQQEVRELAETLAIGTTLFGELNRPDIQDLIDVALDQASSSQRLRVAAYVRNSERGRREMADIEQDIGATNPSGGMAGKSLLSYLPPLIATPLATATGLRNSGDSAQHDYTAAAMFQVVDIQVQITVRTPPPIDGKWSLEGYLTQHYLPLVKSAVAIHNGPTTLAITESDEMGFFRFEHLSGGTYQLGIHFESGIVLVDTIILQ